MIAMPPMTAPMIDNFLESEACFCALMISPFLNSFCEMIDSVREASGTGMGQQQNIVVRMAHTMPELKGADGGCCCATC